MNVCMKKYSVRLHTLICLTVNTKWMNIKILSYNTMEIVEQTNGEDIGR